ncbi:GNAT family N-acetyltransferase [Vibrio lentus]|nr:GNAT family N-acetyltransferase [Vibrio lentus]
MPSCIKEKIVGNCSFNTIDYNTKKVTIGYWLSELNKVKASSPVWFKKLIDIAFNELDMEKVEISAATENMSSRKVCERLHLHWKASSLVTRT